MKTEPRTTAVLQEKLYELLEEIRDQADGLNRTVTQFTVNEKGQVDSAAALKTAEDILSRSFLAKSDKRTREFYLNYLYCALITASLPYTRYDTVSFHDEHLNDAYTFFDLVSEKTEEAEGLTGFGGWHLLVYNGSAVCSMLAGKKAQEYYVTPIELWEETKEFYRQQWDEWQAATPDDGWDDAYDPEETEPQKHPETRKELQQAEVRSEEERALLFRQQGELLRLRFPDYKEYLRRMKKLDKQQHDPHPGLEKHIRQMVTAWLREEGMSLYSAGNPYIDTLVHLRRALRNAGGEA